MVDRWLIDQPLGLQKVDRAAFVRGCQQDSQFESPLVLSTKLIIFPLQHGKETP